MIYKKKDVIYMYENLGYVRVGAIVPKMEVGNVEFNRKEIEKQLKKAEKNKIGIVVTPELSLTGYTCQDLFRARSNNRRIFTTIKNFIREYKNMEFSLYNRNAN